MKITELRVHLKKLSNKEIENLIVELYKSNSFCKEFIGNKIQPEDEDILLQKYKAVILKEFFPKRGEPKLRFSILKKALSDYRKISKFPSNYADLLLYYLECGIDFTIQYGDIDQGYYNRLSYLYGDALRYIFDNKMEKEFDDRCLRIKLSTDDMGWGLAHEMDDLYYAFYDIDA